MGVFARILEALVELWLPAVVLLVVLTLVMGVKRIWTALAVLAVCLFVIAIYQRLTNTPAVDPQPAQRSADATPAARIAPLGVESAQLSDLSIRRDRSPWEFSGSVNNLSATHALVSATVRITRRDCYEGALDPSGCVVLWEGNKRVNLNVPPQSQGYFMEPIAVRGAALQPRGTIRDEFELVGLTGRQTQQGGVRDSIHDPN